MTILSAANSASIVLVSQELPALFSNSDTFALEMRELANEVAAEIAQKQDWRELTSYAEFAGDGQQTVFPRPADFDRMLVSASVDDKLNWFWGYFPFQTVNDWMQWKNAHWGLFSPGGWILLRDGFTFQPAPSSIATFPYISNLIVRAEDGTLKKEFTRDDDTFLLSERLLKLGLIWRWKAQKGMEYAEDLANYEIELAQHQARDAGSQSIKSIPRLGRSRYSIPFMGTAI